MKRLHWHNWFIGILASLMLVIPAEKRIWYDETVSILIANGIGYTVGRQVDTTVNIERIFIAQQNTLSNVFAATVEDNGNSLLYNVLLHYWVLFLGNDLSIYVLFSKLFAISTLFVASRLAWFLYPSSWFVALASLMLWADPTFWGMAHEIRAYSLGTFLALVSGYFLVRLLTENVVSVQHRLLFVFTCLGLFFTHFLSIYLLLFYAGIILFRRPIILRSWPFWVSLLAAGFIICLYIFIGLGGFEQIFTQNERIADEQRNTQFNIAHALLLAGKHTAVNFRVFLPYFTGASWALAIAGVLGCLVIIWGYRQVRSSSLAINYLILGLSGTFGMTALSIISGHYTAFYFRYFIFCMPFASIFTAWCIYSVRLNASKAFIYNLLSTFGLVTIFYVFIRIVISGSPSGEYKYSHQFLSQQIAPNTFYKIEVPFPSDAYLIHALSPNSAILHFEQVAESQNFEVIDKNGSLLFSVPYTRNDK